MRGKWVLVSLGNMRNNGSRSFLRQVKETSRISLRWTIRTICEWGKDNWSTCTRPHTTIPNLGVRPTQRNLISKNSYRHLKNIQVFVVVVFWECASSADCNSTSLPICDLGGICIGTTISWFFWVLTEMWGILVLYKNQPVCAKFPNLFQIRYILLHSK